MRFMLIKVSTEWYRSVFNRFPGGQFGLYKVILTLLVWNKQTVEGKGTLTKAASASADNGPATKV